MKVYRANRTGKKCLSLRVEFVATIDDLATYYMAYIGHDLDSKDFSTITAKEVLDKSREAVFMYGVDTPEYIVVDSNLECYREDITARIKELFPQLLD